MSTFDGFISEFPDIRVDIFRHQPKHRAPLACFLSHIHGDHLAGLESFKSPFIYCSPATRQMLPCLEKYPCRLNYAKGILEARKQTYKHLRNLLKPLPLNTPTTLELRPGEFICVTLLDANHCPGAVMFLFERPGVATLYTGDVRCEPWFINNLVRNPVIIEYTQGLKTLDKIYLDTSFVDDVDFQTKADGLRELLRKVARYPKDTIFFLQAWTYGYEDVWVALSKALKSRIHVDDYKMHIYKSLLAKSSEDKYGAQAHHSPEAPGLVGFMCGNTPHAGCLTLDDSVRLHSCEKGSFCSLIRDSPDVVWIQPIVAHLPDGRDMVELGIGGGGDDLEREAELDLGSPEEIVAFLNIVQDDMEISENLKADIKSFLESAMKNQGNITLDLDNPSFGEEEEMKISEAIKAVAKRTELGKGEAQATEEPLANTANLPKKIKFPYSRHASLSEQRLLVEAFRPRDVWPCTVSPREWLENGISIRRLFGQYCSGTKFEHDVQMEALRATLQPARQLESQKSDDLPSSPVETVTEMTSQAAPSIDLGNEDGGQVKANGTYQSQEVAPDHARPRKRDFSNYSESGDAGDNDLVAVKDLVSESQISTVSSHGLELRAEAFRSMTENFNDQGNWRSVSLISTNDHHSVVDQDLGTS